MARSQMTRSCTVGLDCHSQQTHSAQLWRPAACWSRQIRKSMAGCQIVHPGTRAFPSSCQAPDGIVIYVIQFLQTCLACVYHPTAAAARPQSLPDTLRWDPQPSRPRSGILCQYSYRAFRKALAPPPPENSFEVPGSFANHPAEVH